MWRLIHLWLAMVAGIFLVVASITGIVLSFEPIYEHNQGFYVEDSEELTLAQVVHNLQSRYDEVLGITRDDNGYVSVHVFEDEEQKFYVNPFSGEKIGELIKTPALFDFCRSLHRSLFMGALGRFLMGITAVFLLISCISGVALTYRKQGSLQAYFQKVVKTDFFRDYHTSLGRLLVFSLMVLALSGSYLFLERFSLIPGFSGRHTFDEDTLHQLPKRAVADFPVLNAHKLAELNAIVFPFMEDVEEFYEVKLKDQELLVNQMTGEVVSQLQYPSYKKLSLLSLSLHTGSGNIGWAAVLGLSAIGVLFFIYSGFVIYLKRGKTKNRNPYSKDECSHILLVGSEHGTTYAFASHFQNQLLISNIRCFITDMNSFEPFEKLEQLIIFTSTYSDGDAPANARQFEKLFEKHRVKLSRCTFSVLGFGSSSFSAYCAYAQRVDALLDRSPKTERALEYKTVNKGSIKDYQDWLAAYNRAFGLDLQAPESTLQTKRENVTLSVTSKTDSLYKKEDQTFLLQLSLTKRHKSAQSGDLLVVNPGVPDQERFYSITVIGKSVLLSIRIHEHGLVSNQLDSLSPGTALKAAVQVNPSFHFPKSAPSVVMIANGTGIGPFLGMISGNQKNRPIALYWGGYSSASFHMYRGYLEQYENEGKLKRYQTAYSRSGDKAYVQDALKNDSNSIKQAFNDAAVFMICGSMSMRDGVMTVLEEMYEEEFSESLFEYQSKGLILEDCY